MSYKLSAINKPLGEISYKSTVFAKITDNVNLPLPMRSKYALLINGKYPVKEVSNWGLVLVKGDHVLPSNLLNTIKLSEEFHYLDNDDVIRFTPKNFGIRSLYRNKANTNGFLLTEKCNSYCVMCSQPPKNVDDKPYFDTLFSSLPLIPKSAKELTFSGGEPTLNFEMFIESLLRAKFHLPETAIHVLSNGRTFENENYALEVSNINHHDLMIGIPLYSDDEEVHDFVVQSKGAFKETCNGILNLYKHRVPIEIRFVIHKYTWERMPQFAEFISRNFPFISHINFMGLEREGFGKLNFDDLWVDPKFFLEKLDIAMNILDMAGVNTRIYNFAQCMLPDSLRHKAIVSISDWKNEFKEECKNCILKKDCCGLFKSIASSEKVKVYPEY